MDERQQLEQAIAAQESLRGTLDDAIIDATIEALKQQIATLDPPPLQQRKLATILFTDMVGSTQMIRGLDPEEQMALIDPLVQRLAAKVSEHGGHVCRYTGDGFKAVFGLPVAHENDPAQAIRAGLAIQAEADRIGAELEAKRGMVDFRMRVGISTGLVFSGGETEGEDTIKGEAVNLAARLESAAQPGTVLISHDSYKLVRGVFSVDPLEPIEVKGFSELVAVYQVLRTKPHPFYRGMRGVEGIETRMVGREPEFLQLQKTLWDVIEDQMGQMVTIVGGAGLGKSRLLFEFEKWADIQLKRIIFYKGRARLETQGMPYGLLRDLFASQFGIQDDDSAQIVRDKLETGLGEGFGKGETSEKQAHIIGQLLGYDFQNSPHLKEILEHPQQLRDQAIRYIAAHFKSLAIRVPVLVLLEDLHWADETSLDALNSLAFELRDNPVFILATSRHGLLERRPHWGEGQDFHRRIVLDPLSKRESRNLVAEVLQRVQDVPEVLSELVVSNAEGNPFYVEELVKMLVEDEVIVRDDPTWRVEISRLEQVHVPSTLTGVLQARLDGLSEEERKTLQGASVVGRVFWDKVLEYINGSLEDKITDKEVAEVLDELRSRELIFRRETSTFAEAHEHIFKHALLREVTYQSVLKRVRQAYHALVAEWLIEHAGDRVGEFTGLIADHLKLAGSNTRACQYLIMAGDRARNIFAYKEAINSYEQAIDHLIEAGEFSKAARTLMKLGLTFHNDFQFAEARQAYDQAFNLYQQAGKLEEGKDLLPSPQALRLILGEPQSLDPKTGTGSGAYIETIFSGLVELTSSGEIVPDVAQSWEVLDEGRRYVFHLRDDFTWSDGVPVTAHDFEYAWKRAMDPVDGAVEVEMYFMLKNAEAYHKGDLDWDAVGVHTVDDFTLEVELQSPSISFLYLLGRLYFYPLPCHALKEHGSDWTNLENLVTNGPFRLIELHPGKSIRLEANPSYPGRFPGNVEQIDIYFLENIDPEVRLEMYADNRIDLIWLGWLTNPNRARSKYPEEFRTGPILATDYIGFNTRHPPLNDPRVRRALALATDREYLIYKLYEGLGAFPATGGLLPPGMPGHTEGIALPYDPVEARRLLAQAGYPEGRGFPVIKLRIWPNMLKYGEILQTQWQDNLGIDINSIDLHFEKFLEQYKDLHAWILRHWLENPDPELILDGPVCEQTGWCNEKYNDLIQRASAMMDYEGRLKLYRQADRIIIEEVAVLPISYARSDFLVKPWVRRWSYSSTRGWFWKEVILEPWEAEQEEKKYKEL